MFVFLFVKRSKRKLLKLQNKTNILREDFFNRLIPSDKNVLSWLLTWLNLPTVQIEGVRRGRSVDVAVGVGDM